MERNTEMDATILDDLNNAADFIHDNPQCETATNTKFLLIRARQEIKRLRAQLYMSEEEFERWYEKFVGK
jgi:hypothetical protein